MSNEVSRNPTSRRLAEACDEWFDYRLRHDVWLRSRQGLLVERLPHFTYEATEERAGFARALLRRLATFDESRLSHDELMTLGVLRWDLGIVELEAAVFWHRFQVSGDWNDFVQAQLVLMDRPLATPEERAAYLEAVAHWPRALDQIGETLLRQRRRGVVMPRPTLPSVRDALAPFAAPPPENQFWTGDERLAGVDAIASRTFRARLEALLRDEVGPAARRLLAVFNGEYERAAPEGVGLCQYPGGEEAYHLLIRREVTVDVSPEELHALGLAEMERIEECIAGVCEKLGYGTLTMPQLREALAADPRLQLSGVADEVGTRLAAHLDAIERRYDEFFAWRPAAPAELQPLPVERRSAMAFGFYQDPSPGDPVGCYFYNPSSNSPFLLLNAAALLFHELLPGHHLQICRQREAKQLPAFRRHTLHDGYAEGWGEYASALAEEMGGYADPYDLCGRLCGEADMALDLVLDTGTNALGWSPEQAMTFCRAHSLESERDDEVQMLRDAVHMPAQALTYHFGQLEIQRMRADAEAALGATFEIRAFHEWVLDAGSVPLPLLEEHLRYQCDNTLSGTGGDCGSVLA